MKYKNLIFSLIYLLLVLCSSAQTNDLKVMSFNIRYDNPSDNEYSWANRKEMVFEVLQKYSPGIIGLQEALKGQVDQIQEYLSGYKYTGVGRDDGKSAGEFAVVFYDSLRFEKKGGSSFWLSETPDVPGSKSWGSACTRIVTWVRLLDKKENRILVVFNTHFDHISEQARLESARLLKTRISQIAGTETVILTGDFNATDTSGAYDLLTSQNSSPALIDTRKLAGNNASGPPYTFIGFPFHPENDKVIDFIFISENPDLEVIENSIIDFNRNGRYPSDHLPVLTQFEFIIKK